MSESTRQLNLAERRAVKTFQDERLPVWQQAINNAAGKDIPLDIRWSALCLEGESDYYLTDEYWVLTIFKPLATALAQVAVDDMGKEALQGGLSSIVITYDADTAPISNFENGVHFASGVLTINFQPWRNADDEGGWAFTERVRAIVKVLEQNL